MPLADRLDEVVDRKLPHIQALVRGHPSGTAGIGPGPAPPGAGGATTGAPVTTGAPAPAAHPPAAAPAPGAVAPSSPPGSTGASASGASPQALEVLIRFIPVGVTSAYVAATAPIAEDQTRAHLALVVVFIALCVVTSWVGFVVRVRRRVPVPARVMLRSPLSWPKWQMFTGVVAFASWAVAIHPAALKALVPELPDQAARTAAAIGIVITGYLLTTFDRIMA